MKFYSGFSLEVRLIQIGYYIICINDLEGKTLYYSGKSLRVIQGVLGIHHETCTNCIKNGDIYLGFFLITDTPEDEAEKPKLSLPEIVDLMATKRMEMLKKTSSSRFSKSIIIKKENEEENMEFSSIIAAVNYLKSKDIVASRDQIAKKFDPGKPYKGYIFSKA